MTNELLMRLFDSLVADARKTMVGKNHDYTAASQDALANFKMVAAMLGLKPRQVWAVYFMKHVMAVMAWAKTGKVESEGLAGRFVDLVNYAALGEAIYRTADSGPAWDFDALWDDVAQWSTKTFGTDQERGPAGALKHITKEVQEALQKPDDPKEYADLIILVCDASRRAGLSMEALLKTAHAKMAENKKRTWPKPVEGEPCEHVKEPATTRDVEKLLRELTKNPQAGPIKGDARDPGVVLNTPAQWENASSGGGKVGALIPPEVAAKWVGKAPSKDDDWGQATS